MEKLYASPEEITKNYVEIGVKKAAMPRRKQLLLGIMGGFFIGFASQGSNQAIHTIASVGLAKTLAGALFATGLMLVVIAGGELFTGNCLMLIACLSKKMRLRSMLTSWLVVYIGNLIGSLLLAAAIIRSGQLGFSEGLLGGATIKTAVYKAGLSFENAFFMGVLCNMLVCLAVWMAAAAKDVAGKLLAVFFPIWLFITSGFEHSVANMYYLAAGIFAKGNPLWAEQALGLGVSTQQLQALNWSAMLLNNLLPVTLGNIVGGALLVGAVYWYVYIGPDKKKKCHTA